MRKWRRIIMVLLAFLVFLVVAFIIYKIFFSSVNHDKESDSRELFDAYMRILRDARSEYIKLTNDNESMILKGDHLTLYDDGPHGELVEIIFFVAHRSNFQKEFTQHFKEKYALMVGALIRINESSIPLYKDIAYYCNRQHRRFNYIIANDNCGIPGLRLETVITDSNNIKYINNSEDALRFLGGITADLDSEMIFIEETKKKMEKNYINSFPYEDN